MFLISYVTLDVDIIQITCMIQKHTVQMHNSLMIKATFRIHNFLKQVGLTIHTGNPR